jgi:hypothetical protein
VADGDAGGLPEDGDVEREDGKHRTVDVREYNRRVDFHRSIHLDPDDGALLALCEAYGERRRPEEP